MKLQTRKGAGAPLARASSVFEVRDLDESAGTFDGHLSVFFPDVDDYGTAIAPGAFAETLAAHAAAGTMPAMLWQHDWHEVCGRWLAMEEDNFGLAVKGKLELETQRGREALALMRGPQPALNGLSAGFYVQATEVRGNVTVFTRVELLEGSLVTFPALARARVGEVRCAPDSIVNTRDLETLLRDEAGYSHREAKIIASQFRPKQTPRDVAQSAGLTPELSNLLATLKKV